MDIADVLQGKPPLGLKPRKIHIHERIIAIIHAIQRYIEAGKIPPIEWTNELQSLCGILAKLERWGKL